MEKEERVHGVLVHPYKNSGSAHVYKASRGLSPTAELIVQLVYMTLLDTLRIRRNRWK